MREHEIIVALASAPGSAAIAVIRGSGAGCRDLVLPCFTSRSPQDRYAPADWPERVMVWGDFFDPDSGARLDDVMLVLFGRGRSYTGEESFELYCHGGPLVVQKILRLLCQRGARPAEAGEFTRRAFENGKLDLTAVEGIDALIHATSEQQFRAARHLVEGKLARLVEKLREELLRALVYLEASIDFPDEGDTAGAHRQTARRPVNDVCQTLTRLERSWESGRVASQGLSVALYGAPNVGKSTLFNALLGHERAIVTAEAGTTRDFLEERCLVQGRLLRLIDMAGVREEAGLVERIGITRAEDWGREADLVLLLGEKNSSPEELDRLEAKARERAGRSVLRVLTKADQGVPSWSAEGWIKVSCRDDHGLDVLQAALVAAVDSSMRPIAEDEGYLSTARQWHAVLTARKALDQFERAFNDGLGEECLAFEVQEAARALASIVGVITTDDMLDALFSRFCVGK